RQATSDAARCAVFCEIQAEPASVPVRALGFLAKLQGLAARIAGGGPVAEISVPVGPFVRSLARTFVKAGSVVQSSPSKPYAEASLPEPARRSAEIGRAHV